MIKRGMANLLCLSLVSHRSHGLGDSLLVAEELHGGDRLEVLVQLVDEGDAGRKVEAHDLGLGEVVQVLHDS